MADTDDTPPAVAPKPPARRAPRKSSTAKSAGTKSAAEKPAGSAAADKPAAKSRRKPASSASEAAAPAPAKKSAAPPKPRSTKRATPAPKRPAKPTSAAAEAEKTPVWKSKAAIAGGLAAVGAAATAALLSLRGSTPKNDDEPTTESTESKAEKTTAAPTKPIDSRAKAHTPDGTDASKSLDAGIADENVIPEKE